MEESSKFKQELDIVDGLLEEIDEILDKYLEESYPITEEVTNETEN